jgi:ferrous iron transport protein A
MTDARVVTATQMSAGQSGEVVAIEGGHGLVGRLGALGIRPGRKIRKVSSAFMRGPVIFQVDRCEIAVGFGMAQRIIVKTE